jgi:hypothetical protein
MKNGMERAYLTRVVRAGILLWRAGAVVVTDPYGRDIIVYVGVACAGKVLIDQVFFDKETSGEDRTGRHLVGSAVNYL